MSYTKVVMTLRNLKPRPRVTTKQKIFRAILHIPVGVINYLLLGDSVAGAVLFFAGFMIYELNDDWHLKDGAFYDVFGYLIGLAVTGLGYRFSLWTTLISLK